MVRYSLISLVLCVCSPTIAQTTDSLKTVQLADIVITASRIEEDLSLSPVSIQKASAIDFRRTASPSFFDALENVRGVHMLVPSIGFKVINTRGFANTTNVRFVQMVDGMDIQAPHLGTPIANMLGPSDLDIESVEIIPGTASALYGMNAINGLASFSTKDAFRSPGFSMQQKIGLNRIGEGEGAKPFTETSLRVSKLVTEKLAFKLNLAFMHGTDWIASNRHDLNANANATTGLLGSNNPAYDPVNSYGNESPNRRTLQLDGKNYVVARTGYFEKDVVDYTLQNIKGDVALQYALTEERQLRYTYRVAHLDNIYQRSNRFRLEDYILQQHGISYKSKSVQFLSYVNVENTGKSYNARSMAENIDRNFKSDDIWFSEYALAFARAIDNGSAAAEAHRLARSHSDAGRPSPGTREFDGLIQNLGNINNWDYGAALRVRSQMLHMEMVTNLSEKILPALKSDLGMDVQVGIDQRTYFIIPDGNYFINPEETGARISYGRSGGFIQANKLIWQRLRAGATLRLDKNDYYDLRLNPRLTLVYAAGRRHHLRGSYQNGYRFPSVFEAFSNVNSGGVKRVGGLKVMSEGIFENAYNRASIDAFQAAIVRDVNTMGITRNEAIIKNQNLLKKNDYSYVVPEKIRSFEGGYRGSFFDEDLQVDLDFYYNRYQNFIAQVEMNIPRTTIADSISFYLSERRKQDRYRMWTNSKTIAYNYGAGLGLKYAIATGYKVSGNVTYSKLQRRSNNDGLEDGFNTPEWILNVSIGNDNVFKEIGFNISCRWQSEYYWQSFLVNGWVDSFRTVDAQLSRTIKKITLKVGGTNVTNERYYSFLGGPSIGGFYYLMIQYRAD